MRVDTKLIPRYLKSLECRLWLSAVLEFLLMVLLYLGGGNPCPNGEISFSRIPQALKHQIWNIAQVTVFWSPWINCANVALLTDLSNATASQVSNAEVSHTLEVDPERIQQLPSEQRFTASGPMADGNRTGKEAKGCKDGKAKSSRWPEVRKTYKHNSPATSHMLAATARWLNFTFREVFCTNFSWRKNTLQLVAWTANKKWSSRWSINTLPPVKRGSRVSRMRESNNLNSGPAIWRNSPLERAIRKAPVVKSVSPWPSQGGRFCLNVWNTCAFFSIFFCKPLVFKLFKQQPTKISTWLLFYELNMAVLFAWMSWTLSNSTKNVWWTHPKSYYPRTITSFQFFSRFFHAHLELVASLLFSLHFAPAKRYWKTPLLQLSLAEVRGHQQQK